MHKNTNCSWDTVLTCITRHATPGYLLSASTTPHHVIRQLTYCVRVTWWHLTYDVIRERPGQRGEVVQVKVKHRRHVIHICDLELNLWRADMTSWWRHYTESATSDLPQRDKFGTFSDHISVHFFLGEPKETETWSVKSLEFVLFVAILTDIWAKSDIPHRVNWEWGMQDVTLGSDWTRISRNATNIGLFNILESQIEQDPITDS